MKLTVTAFSAIVFLLEAGAIAAAGAEPTLPFAAIELRFESVNEASGALERCDVVQGLSAQFGSLASWATFGAARAGEENRIELVNASTQCGVGATNGTTPAGVAPPLVILEASTALKLDPAAMDPGPTAAAQLVLALSSRRLVAVGADGKAQYGSATADRRVARIAEGEEFVLPVSLREDAKPSPLGAREVVVRVRVRQSAGATRYGAIEVVGVPAGAEILLDGGTAGSAGAEGTLLIPNVPVGRREIRVGGAAHGTARWANVVAGRTVALSFDTKMMDRPPGASFVRAGKNGHGFAEFRRSRDDAVMVLIPSGEYTMGNLETEGKPPPHTVYVSEFLIDKLPVTQARFRHFAAASGRVVPPTPYWGVRDDDPAVFVRWDDARAYCEWAGARLPTEAEREKAARGTDGRKFPWGNEEPNPDRAVFRRNWGSVATDAVGSHPTGASPYGLLDAGGNVWEFCEDWYDPGYYQESPARDPMGPRTGRARIVRGGSWDSRPSVLSSSARNFAYIGYREADFGFRCAADPRR